MNIYFGENIKRLRTEKGMTQETLANFLGVTFQTISKWERGETYPDISVIPSISTFFNVSTDDLLGVDRLKKEEKINEYLDIYKNRGKDKDFAFNKLCEAVKEFPGEYRLLIRYMDLLAVKTVRDNPDYEKNSQEILVIYEKIQNHCTVDSIRMWSKRLVCQHLHGKAYYTGINIYQEQVEEILKEMPAMLNSKEYLSTMLITDHDKHIDACRRSIEEALFILEHSVNHYCHRYGLFSPQFRIEAMNKMNTVLNTFYTEDNYGYHWLSVIYNYGHLGHLYFEIGDTENALKNLKLCATLAKKYDDLPQKSEMNSQFFGNRTYAKGEREETMCGIMKTKITEHYELPDSFKETKEFKEIIEMLGG